MKEHDNSNHETDFHIRLMDYISGEMNPVEAQAFKNELDANPEKHREYEQILGVQQMMHAMDQDEAIAEKAVNEKEKGDVTRAGSSAFNWIRPFAIAAGLLLAFMIGGYLTNFQMSWSDKGFYAGFGPVPVVEVETEVSPEAGNAADMNEIFEIWQQQQMRMLSELLADEREIQQAQLIDLLGQYSEEIETRRLIDLQIISSELQYQREYFTMQTLEQDLVLNEIIEIVNTRIED